ncbi:hypothetical protein LSCM1_05118 [Leishmania martiniquensis]|uniref:RUN domain-containing protein n=1 Tax=Leishmania martiniquensis TaxID=1580590 RepID=A0A836KKN0_9TRYP|nr:hypothetical protein LSCM1_05118 [Leishmania martiniquensis]
MDSAIAQLRECVRELLAYHLHILRNEFEPQPSPLAEPQPPHPQPHDSSALADAIEGFLTELTRVLSMGLCDSDGGLWRVLELLECVPGRMQAAAEATAATTEAAAAGEHRVREPLQRLQRFRFASQMVYVARSTFSAVSHTLRARILLRLTLNQGCLLAALELLRRWCWPELLVLYAARRGGLSSAAADSTALLVQPHTDSDLWNSFVAAIAPVAGPPVGEIAAGAPKVATQPFHLQLFVSGLDDNSAASHSYYTQVQRYVFGRQPTRPSALACYRAALQRPRRLAAEDSSCYCAAFPGEGVASSSQIAQYPAEQLVLRVESLPVDRRSASAKATAPLLRTNVSYDSSSSTLSSHVATQAPFRVHGERLRNTKKRRQRPSSRSTTATEEAAALPMPASKTGGHSDEVSDIVSRVAAHSSAVVTEARICRGASGALQEAAATGKEDGALQTDVPHVLPAVAEAVAREGVSRAFGTALTDSPTADPLSSPPALCASTSACVTLDTSSASTPFPELLDLRHRLWLCWLAVVTRAELEERARIAVQDVDANTS